MTESSTKSAAVAKLRDLGYFAIRLPANAGMPAGMPDVMVLLRGFTLGRAMFLEFKEGDAEPTRIQLETMRALRAGGAMTAVVRSVNDAVAAVKVAER